MSTLTLRIADEHLALALRERAKQRHRSVDQEVVDILRGALDDERPTAAELVAQARAIAALSPQAQTTDSVTLLREERDL